MALKFTRAIVRLPADNFSDGIASAIGGGSPSLSAALAQHRQYCVALGDCGLKLTSLAADPRYPDSTFVEDTAILSSEAAIITRPGAASRLGEAAIMLPALRDFFSAIRQIEAPGTLDGGDVCEVDGKFIIGHSERTNAEGIRQLTGYLAEFGHESVVIDIRDCHSLLHLKSGMSYVGDGVLVIDPDSPFVEALAGYNLISVKPEEAYAANCVRVNDRVLLAAGFPRLAEILTTRGFAVLALPMSEFRKMDGGLSCLSLRF
jgi:dimethylargininase